MLANIPNTSSLYIRAPETYTKPDCGAEGAKLGRIVFLDYLRAIACLIVVFGHIYMVGVNSPSMVQIWAPAVTGKIFGDAYNVYDQAHVTVALATGINVGALGVGIFFLVSGFVIQRTLDRERPFKFMIRRIFRIFPTCAAVVLLAAATITLYCFLHDVPNPMSVANVLSSAFILNGFNFQMQTVPVLWSLEVELMFYCIMAIASMFVGRLELRDILSISAGCALFSIALSALHLGISIAHVGATLNQITLILVGSMIYRAWDDRWSIKSIAFCAASVGVFLLSYAAYSDLHDGTHTGIDIPNAAWSLLVFLAALVTKMEWKWLVPLKKLGDISYPLYLVHVPISWIAMTVFADLGFGLHLSCALAMTLVIALAWAVHVLVEKPTHEAGRLITGGSQTVYQAPFAT